MKFDYVYREPLEPSRVIAWGLILVLLFLSSLARAGTANLSWSTVTTLTDGTPITTAVTYSVYKGLQGQTKVLLVSGLTGTSYTDIALPTGVWCYDMTASVSGNPLPSAHSNEGCKTIAPPPPPNPPVLTVAMAVYQPKPALNGYTLVAVGTVKLGVPCDPDQDVNGRHVVNRASVKWTGTARPQVVVAMCG